MQPLARLVTRRPWLVLAIWGVLALICAVPASLAPARLTADPGSMPSSESGNVTKLLANNFGERDTNTVLLVTQTAQALTEPQTAQQYDAFVAGLSQVPGVTRVLRYDAQTAVKASSPDGKLALTVAQIPLFEGATPALNRVREYVQTREAPGFDIRVTGGQAIAADFTEFAEGDTKRSELFALPLIAALLLLVFGALVAAALPLAVGVLSITAAMAGLYLLTFLIPTSTFAQSIITLLSLGAGIDYALLMVNRFREELKKDSDSQAAAYRTVLTAGRSVAFSGVTVALAMAALLIPPIAFVRSLGIGGVLAVLFTVLSSITALPALLTLLGERVNWPRLRPRWRGLEFGQSARESALWTALARRVTARPGVAVVLSVLFLLFLAIPAKNMKIGYAGAWGLVQGVESRDALAAVRDLGAGGLLSQFEVILDLKSEKYGPVSRAAFRQTVERVQALPGVQAVISPFVTAGTVNGGSLNDLAALNRRSFSADRMYLRFTVVPDGYLRADKIDPFEKRLRCRAGRRAVSVPPRRRTRRRARIQQRHHRGAAHRRCRRVRRNLFAADGGLSQPVYSPQEHRDEQSDRAGRLRRRDFCGAGGSFRRPAGRAAGCGRAGRQFAAAAVRGAVRAEHGLRNLFALAGAGGTSARPQQR